MLFRIAQYTLNIFLLIVFATSYGCMANVTRAVPVTPLEPELASLPRPLAGKKVALVLFDTRDTKVDGGHHEGLMQVRQPWIYGLSREQKEILYNNAPEVASMAFAVELGRQGVHATTFHERGEAKGFDLLLTGTIATVEINTYGKGTVEGVGSAGNYWESTVVVAQVELTDVKSGNLLWSGNLRGYAKMEPSPAQLDWTMLTLGGKLLKGALELGKLQAAKTPGEIASAGKGYLEAYKASYAVERPALTPVEVAGRYAARAFLAELAKY